MHIIINFHSEFCGMSNCKKCLEKTRPYPAHNENNKKRGIICVLCDRKFYVKEILKESMEKIEEMNLVVKSLSN
jgi:hypothetical protein